MEMASFMAGERWSDHPACTHPLLADLARMVNDIVSNRSRSLLVPMIPSVIGLTSDDLHVDVAIALRAATTALPIAAVSRQHVLATAIIRSERVLAELDGLEPGAMSVHSRQVLDEVPEAEAWARTFANDQPISPWAYRAKIAPRILSVAVEAVAQACAPDVEQQLIDLLAATIAECRELIPAAEPSQQRAPEVSGSRAGGSAPRVE